MGSNREGSRAKGQVGRSAERRLARGAALTLGAAVAAVPAVDAAAFNVINLNDAGAGSLRQAVLDANGAAGADIVTFQAGLTGTITLTTGQIPITDSVDIQGPGAAVLAVDGNAASRLFYLYNGTALLDVTISGLTLTGGGGVTFGGAIIDFGENLELRRRRHHGEQRHGRRRRGRCHRHLRRRHGVHGAELRDHRQHLGARDGGAIYFYTTGGPMTVENTEISGNSAVDDGGGIYLYDITDDLTVTGSTISGNSAGGFGGGIYFYQTDGGTQTIDHSTLAGNSADLGGAALGVFFDTPFAIDHSTLSGNTATAGGGVFTVFSYGAPVLVSDSTLSGNVATSGDGGGLFLYGLYAGGTFAVEHSTIAGNTGSGFFALAGPVPVDHVIAADNSTDDLATALAGSFDVRFSLVEDPGAANISDNGGNVFNSSTSRPRCARQQRRPDRDAPGAGARRWWAFGVCAAAVDRPARAGPARRGGRIDMGRRRCRLLGHHPAHDPSAPRPSPRAPAR